ncbi:phage baseplate assembly protein [Salmonella enterica]|nr:phage baseplate assembly protein [Salmonella enterica]
MLAGTGRVTSLNDTEGVQKIQYAAPGEVKSDTPRLAEFGFSSGLPVGSDVVMVFPGGDRTNGVIIASGHQATRFRNLKPGEAVMYDQWGHTIMLKESGIEVNAAGDDVTVNNAGTLKVVASACVLLDTPLVKTTGDILDNCQSNTKTLRELREAYNRHDHNVEGVEKGGDSVKSNPPGECVK